jgi:chromosome segregation ATPase
LQESEKLLNANVTQEEHRLEELRLVRRDLDQQRQLVKEEEEKRSKAIGLLKSVRQKLVKTEKEKEDIVKELEIHRSREKDEESKDQSNRIQWESQMQALKDCKEKELQEATAKMEREFAAKMTVLQKEAKLDRERLEAEQARLKVSLHPVDADLTGIRIQSDSTRELSNKDSKFSALESTFQTLSRQKDDLFDQLQMRSAELESSQSLLEVLQSRNKELEFRLRESTDEISTLADELLVARQGSNNSTRAEGTSSEDIARLLLETEGKYESRLGEARNKIKMLEKDRLLAEDEWNRGINEKSRSLERLRLMLEAKEKELESLTNGQKDTVTIKDRLELSVEKLSQTIREQTVEIEALRTQLTATNETETAMGQQLHDASERADTLELQLENAKERESQLKLNTKVFDCSLLPLVFAN